MQIVLADTSHLYSAKMMYTIRRTQHQILKDGLFGMVREITKINPSYFQGRPAPANSTPEETGAKQKQMLELAEQVIQSKKSRYAKGEEKLKALWRRVAATCHPDKTEDPEKIKLFLRAKEAKEGLDEFELELLLADLDSGNFNDANYQDRYALLISKMTEEINMLRNSPLYPLYTLMQSDKALFDLKIKSGVR